MTTTNRHNQGIGEHPQAEETGSFLVAYYFLPLESPLSLENGSMTGERTRPPIHEPGYEDDYLDFEWDDEQGLMGVRISCRIHQIPSLGTETGLAAYGSALRAVQVAFPHLERDDESPVLRHTSTSDGEHASATDEVHNPVPPPVVTVVEVAVRVQNDDNDSVLEGFDTAVDFVANLQRVYSALNRQPLATVTRTRLPWVLPCAIREVTHGETEPQWPASIGRLFTRPPDQRQFMPMPSDKYPARWTAADLSRANTAVLAGPLRHVHETWRNGGVAFEQGDYAVAAILLGATCEQFIRALLLCLIWEDDASPESAAELMYHQNGNTKRASDLLKELKCRLSVSPSHDESAVSHARSVLELRNQVLHRTHEPNVIEVEAALDAGEKFAGWAREGLLSRLERYPTTCDMALAPDDMDESQAALLEMVLTTTYHPVRPHEAILNYQVEIDRHLRGNESMRERKAVPDPTGEWLLMSFTYPNGVIRWFGLNQSIWLAFVAKPPENLSESQRRALAESLEQVRTERDEFGDRPIIVIRWNNIDPQPQSRNPQLYSWFRISPTDRADRYASCPMPYIAPG